MHPISLLIRFGPWGGDGGNTHPVEKPKDEELGALIGVEGWNVRDQGELTVTDLKFIWQERKEFHDDSEDEEDDSSDGDWHTDDDDSSNEHINPFMINAIPGHFP